MGSLAFLEICFSTSHLIIDNVRFPRHIRLSVSNKLKLILIKNKYRFKIDGVRILISKNLFLRKIFLTNNQIPADNFNLYNYLDS